MLSALGTQNPQRVDGVPRDASVDSKGMDVGSIDAGRREDLVAGVGDVLDVVDINLRPRAWFASPSTTTRDGSPNVEADLRMSVNAPCFVSTIRDAYPC